MKNVMMAAAALAAVSTVANAGTFMDFSQTSNWQGWYAGVNGALAKGDTDWTYLAGGQRADHKMKGGSIGAQGGYNFQFGNWVVGPEASISMGDVEGEARCPNASFSCHSKIEDVSTVGVRGGYAVGPLLPYLTVGAANGRVENYTQNAAGTRFEDHARRNGLMYGAGMEADVCPNWSVKAEWQRVDFNSVETTVDAGLAVNLEQNVDTFKVGANYRF